MNIHTYRLQDGEFIEINEVATSNVAAENIEPTPEDFASKKESVKTKNFALLLDSIKSKKALVKILLEIPIPSWIKILLFTIIFVLTSLLGLSIFVTVLLNSRISKSKNDLHNAMFARPIEKSQLIAFHDFHDMLLISQNIFNPLPFYGASGAQFFDGLKLTLDKNILEQSENINTLLSQMSLSENGINTLQEVQNKTLALSWPNDKIKNIPMAASMFYNVAFYMNILNKTMKELGNYSTDEQLIIDNSIAVLYTGINTIGNLLNQNVFFNTQNKKVTRVK